MYALKQIRQIMTETGKRAENATISDLGIKNSTAHWNLTPSELIAISLKEGQAKLTSQKAITINTGKFTGRSLWIDLL